MVPRLLTTKQKKKYKKNYKIIYPCIKRYINSLNVKSVNHDARRLIFVGRFDPQKDLKEFARVALHTLNFGWREPLIIGYGDQEYLN